MGWVANPKSQRLMMLSDCAEMMRLASGHFQMIREDMVFLIRSGAAGFAPARR